MSSHSPAQPALRAEEYRKLAALLHAWTGIRLHAKEHLMLSRLAPRLRERKLQRYRDYLQLLQEQGRDSAEGQAFINALTTNKTAFFREAHHFTFLVERLFSEVKARALAGGPRRLRLYSAGCSRGAEPYTMALLAAAHLPAAQGWNVRILATDLDTDVLKEAAEGLYPAEELEDVPVALRKRWFAREAQGLRIVPEAANLVTFKRANLIAQPFPVKGKFDAVFCRNVMIYFDRPTQEKLVEDLCRLIVPEGYLVIGHSEGLLGQHMERVPDVVGVYRPHAGKTSRKPEAELQNAPPKKPSMRARARSVKPAAHKAPPRRPKQPLPELPHKRIVLGEWFSAKQPTVVSTLLGSCVAACLYDPVAGIGGMNHFMLPASEAEAEIAARFGIHAMEILINELMRKGAVRRRILAKAFGAAAVNRTLTSSVAAQNGTFIREFLARENIPLVVERLGGTEAREVYMRTDNGEAHVRRIAPNQGEKLAQHELEAWKRLSMRPPPAEPFNPDDALL